MDVILKTIILKHWRMFSPLISRAEGESEENTRKTRDVKGTAGEPAEVRRGRGAARS